MTCSRIYFTTSAFDCRSNNANHVSSLKARICNFMQNLHTAHFTLQEQALELDDHMRELIIVAKVLSLSVYMCMCVSEFVIFLVFTPHLFFTDGEAHVEGGTQGLPSRTAPTHVHCVC